MPEKSTTINPDLLKERKLATLSSDEFALWWHDGEVSLADKRELEKTILEDDDLRYDGSMAYLSHKELYEETIRKSMLTIKKVRQMTDNGNGGINNLRAILGGSVGPGIVKEGFPIGVHYVMFLPTIMGQGTPEQQGEWLPRAWNCEIIGTYAQTELGHGTFVRGLETTATYDPKTQEFVLDSPTLTSYKWWPGGLGHTANYAVVVAQLYTQGKCEGVHPFIVQLRDEETHMPMPGIKIGEIGAKLGMKSVNNGFLGFEKVRIPRMNMLMRNSKVLEDGTYKKAPASVLTYGTMMFVRVVIIKDMVSYLSKAVTIATRYSAVRRQSPIDPNLPEPQILDHVMQQFKIFPHIARTIVYKVTADYLWEMYNQVTGELDKGNLERLPELHALSCCLKAVCTADTAAAIETLRLSCGGHGYMESSNLPSMYGLVTAACTYEGENTVMFLQTARYLMKAWSQAISGAPLVPTVAYLGEAVKNKGRQRWNSTLPGIITALQAVAAHKIRLAYESVEKAKTLGFGAEDAANRSSILLVQAAEAHCRALIVDFGFTVLSKPVPRMSQTLTSLLRSLMELYALEESKKCMGDILRFTTITEEDINYLQSWLEKVLSSIRPNAVAIVDGFDIPDGVLNSTLGAYDGNVYQRLFDEAQKSPLNQEPVNKSFNLYMKPFMKSSL